MLSCHLHSPEPWLIAPVLELFIIPLKTHRNQQALTYSSEYQGDNRPCMPTQEAMSDDYASAKIKFRRKPATNKSWEYKQ
jgi:hypothetical protein